MTSDLRLFAGGLKSLFPLLVGSGGTGGTIDARYCYAVWMRHLRLIADAGVEYRRATVVELGPGDSVGVGFAALLTTSERYVALDVVPHAAAVVQTTLLDAVTELVRSRAPIPDQSEFPKLFPALGDYAFPAELLADDSLERLLSPERVERIRNAIPAMAGAAAEAMLRYMCPWSMSSVEAESVDLVFSQAALQEIDNRIPVRALRHTFECMATWLKPGGIMSHQIDLGMYGAEPWDRHWTYSDAEWSVIRGRRPNYINREPLSAYEGLCGDFGFDILRLDVVRETPVTPTSRLASRFASLSSSDRTARAAHLVAVKR